MKTCVTWLFLFFVATLACAETMTLQSAWEHALRDNPRIQRQTLALDTARMQVGIEQDERLPRLYAKSGYQYVSEVGSIGILGRTIDMGINDRWDFAVGIQQPLFTGYRVSSRIEGAGLDTLSACAGYRLQALSLRLQLAVLYWQVEATDEQGLILQRGIDRADNQLHRLRALLSAGQAVPIDTLEIANYRLECQTSLAGNRHQRAILLARIEELVGCPVEPVVVPEQTPVFFNAGQFEEQALAYRPEFVQNDARRMQQEQFRRQALSALYPQVSATAEYHYGKPGVQTVDPEWDDYYTVGLQLSWNAFDWGQSREKERVAELGGRQLAADERQMRAQVTREVREVVEQMNSLSERITLQGQLIQQESQRRSNIQNRFEFGQATALDLRDAENKLTEAELTLSQLTAQWQQSYYQLQYVAGTLGGVQ